MSILMSYFSLLLVVLLHVGVSKGHSNNSAFHQSESKKNIGCELTYNAQAILQINAFIFYSQILVNSSEKDVRSLVSNLITFISNCCMSEAMEMCFQDKNSIFVDRLCEDQVLPFQNQEIHVCCRKEDAKRVECFRILRNGPAITMPEIDTVIPFWAQCLEYIMDQNTFIEMYIYNLSRQYRKFPAKTMSKIILTSLKTYKICCKASTSIHCVDDMESQNKREMKNLIAEDNKICAEYKNTGLVKTIIWGVQYFTLHHPNGLIVKASEFAASYRQFSSNCCDEKKWTSDCFLDEDEVLLLLFCAKSSSPVQLDCCHLKGREKAECLDNIANQEAQVIAKDIKITSEQLCRIQNAPDGSLIIWYTYEYVRRHRNDSLDIVLKSISEFGLRVKQCCVDTNRMNCLSKHLAPLGFFIYSELTTPKEN